MGVFERHSDDLRLKRADYFANPPLHGRADILKRLIANIGAALQHVKEAAEQFKNLDRWGCLLRYISERIAPVIGPPKPPLGLLGAG